MPARASWSGPLEELSAAIAPFLMHPNFIQYGETMGSPLQINKIIPHRELWRRLREKQPNLSFVQSALEDCLEATYHKVKDKWPKELARDELAAWKVRLARRIRAQGRAIAQAQRKNPQAGWLLQLWKGPVGSTPAVLAPTAVKDEESMDRMPKDDSELEIDSDNEPLAALKRPACAQGINFEVGFDVESGVAWRLLPDGTKEFTSNYKYEGDADDNDECKAIFSDGKETFVPGFCVGDARASGVFARGGVWNAIHQVSGRGLTIALRMDRSPIYCLYEDGLESAKKRQICMVRISHFGPEPQASALALQCLTKVGEAFAEGSVDIDGIYACRDSAMKEMGVKPPNRGTPKKRPCASAQAAPIKRRPAAAPAAEDKDESSEESGAGDDDDDNDLPPLHCFDGIGELLYG